MNCRVIPVDNFRREAKRLAKKYASLKGELAQLVNELLNEPRKGISLGSDIYKVRLAVKSKGKGKSGGVRVVTKVVEVQLRVNENPKQTDIFLLSIFDKSEYESISDKRIREIVGSLDLPK